MNAKDFIELYEVYRDYKTEMSLLDEDYRGFKNYYDWKKHTDPARAAELKSRNIARTKEKAKANLDALDPELRQKRIITNLKKNFTTILKKCGVLDPTYYYDEKKQIASTTPEEIAQKHPEAMQAIIDLIDHSGIDFEIGEREFNNMFGTYDDRKKTNATYSLNRKLYREPDEPDVREFKQNKRQSLMDERERIAQELAAETDISEFSKKLYDLTVNQHLSKVRPLIAKLLELIPEGDPRRRFCNIVINKKLSLQVKHQKKQLEDMLDKVDDNADTDSETEGE